MRSSFTQESDFRQQRDFGQKFSATFEFIGAHWRGLGRALLTIVLPIALVQGVISGLLQQQFLTAGADSSRMPGRGGMLDSLSMLNRIRESPYYWVSVLMGASFVTLLVLTVYGYVRCCLQARDTSEPIGAGQVWAVVKELFLSSFLSYFGIIVVVLIGFAFLFIPGIYLSIVFSLFYVVKVMEGGGFGAVFSRCRELIKGKWWSTFGLLFVMSFMLGLLLAVVGGVFGGFLYAALRGTFGSMLGDDNAPITLLTIIVTTLTSILNLLIYPPLLLALAFQYFNLVERHDGVGLRNMVNQLGQAPAPVQNTTYRPDEEGEY